MEYIVLDVNDHKVYKTNAQVLNEVFGNNYGGWMKATWPTNNPKTNFRVWFPKLAKKDALGNPVPAANKCFNAISADWEKFYYVDLKGADQLNENSYTGYDLIFAKEPDGKCIFRGVYQLDVDASKEENRFVSKRIATKVKLFGKPVNRIEL